MSVYVDAPVWRLGRMRMCHMVADTPEELHAMALDVGLKREWYQRHASFPHYDIALVKRGHAVSLGAIEVNKYQLVEVMRRVRAAATLDPELAARWRE